MTVRRTWCCNLCGKSLTYADQGAMPLHWRPNGWREGNWNQAENHICFACLHQIHELYMQHKRGGDANEERLGCYV